MTRYSCLIFAAQKLASPPFLLQAKHGMCAAWCLSIPNAFLDHNGQHRNAVQIIHSHESSSDRVPLLWSRVELAVRRLEQFFLGADQLLLGHAALLDLGLLLLAVLLRVSAWSRTDICKHTCCCFL